MQSRKAMRGGGHKARRQWPVCVAAGLLLITIGAHAEDSTLGGRALGASVDGLLAKARRLNPEIAARALDAAAATAGARMSGSLPDPTLRVTQDEIDVVSGPRRAKQFYTIEQEF